MMCFAERWPRCRSQRNWRTRTETGSTRKYSGRRSSSNRTNPADDPGGEDGSGSGRRGETTINRQRGHRLPGHPRIGMSSKSEVNTPICARIQKTSSEERHHGCLHNTRICAGCRARVNDERMCGRTLRNCVQMNDLPPKRWRNSGDVPSGITGYEQGRRGHYSSGSAHRSSTCSSPKSWIARGVRLNRGVLNVIRASGIVSACLFAVCILVCWSSWRVWVQLFCVFAFCIMTTAPPHTISAWRPVARAETWTVCNRIWWSLLANTQEAASQTYFRRCHFLHDPKGYFPIVLIHATRLP